MKKIRFALFTFSICFVLPVRANLTSNNVFVRDFYAAYKAKDAIRMAEFYTADATFIGPSFELDLRGTDQIRELFTKVFQNMNRSTGKSSTPRRSVTAW